MKIKGTHTYIGADNQQEVQKEDIELDVLGFNNINVTGKNTDEFDVSVYFNNAEDVVSTGDELDNYKFNSATAFYNGYANGPDHIREINIRLEDTDNYYNRNIITTTISTMNGATEEFVNQMWEELNEVVEVETGYDIDTILGTEKEKADQRRAQAEEDELKITGEYPPEVIERAQKIFDTCKLEGADIHIDKDGISVLVRDTVNNVGFWFDIYPSKEGDLEGDWNQYIFNNTITEDLVREALQENGRFFEAVFEVAEDYAMEKDAIKWNNETNKYEFKTESKKVNKKENKKGISRYLKEDFYDGDGGYDEADWEEEVMGEEREPVEEYTILFEDGSEIGEQYHGEFITEDKDEADDLFNELKEEHKLDQVFEYFRKVWEWDRVNEEYYETDVEVYFRAGDELEYYNEGLSKIEKDMAMKDRVSLDKADLKCKSCGKIFTKQFPADNGNIPSWVYACPYCSSENVVLKEEADEHYTDLEPIPDKLYRKILSEVVEEYQEALEDDDEDIFGGTEDSYANEMLEDRLADLYYDNDFKMYVSEHWDTTTQEDAIKSYTFVLDKLADAIRNNTLSKYKKVGKKTESNTEEYWDGTEIARDGFMSLMKFNFGTDSKGNNYIVTVDANDVKRFRADNDKEAVEIYNQFKEEYNNTDHADLTMNIKSIAPREESKKVEDRKIIEDLSEGMTEEDIKNIKQTIEELKTAKFPEFTEIYRNNNLPPQVENYCDTTLMDDNLNSVDGNGDYVVNEEQMRAELIRTLHWFLPKDKKTEGYSLGDDKESFDVYKHTAEFLNKVGKALEDLGWKFNKEKGKFEKEDITIDIEAIQDNVNDLYIGSNKLKLSKFADDFSGYEDIGEDTGIIYYVSAKADDYEARQLANKIDRCDVITESRKTEAKPEEADKEIWEKVEHIVDAADNELGPDQSNEYQYDEHIKFVIYRDFEYEDIFEVYTYVDGEVQEDLDTGDVHLEDLDATIVDIVKKLQSKEVKTESRYIVYDYADGDTMQDEEEKGLEPSQFTIYDNKADDFYYDELGNNPVFDKEEDAEEYIKKNLTETKYGDSNPDKIVPDAYCKIEKTDNGYYINCGIGTHTSLGGGNFTIYPENYIADLYEEVKSLAKEKKNKGEIKRVKDNIKDLVPMYNELIPEYNQLIEEMIKDLTPFAEKSKQGQLTRADLDNIEEITGRVSPNKMSTLPEFNWDGKFGKLISFIGNLKRWRNDLADPLARADTITITESKEVKTESKEDTKYIVCSYYDEKLHGLEDDLYTNEWDDVEEFAHRKLMQGNMIEIENTKTGKSKRINPDEYNKEFDGEFIVRQEELDEDKKITEAEDLKAKADAVKEKVEKAKADIGLKQAEEMVDTENELTDGIKKEIIQYAKQQGLDVEKLQKQGVLDTVGDTLDSLIGDMVSKSAVEFMDNTGKTIEWDFEVKDNNINVIWNEVE